MPRSSAAGCFIFDGFFGGVRQYREYCYDVNGRRFQGDVS